MLRDSLIHFNNLSIMWQIMTLWTLGVVVLDWVNISKFRDTLLFKTSQMTSVRNFSPIAPPNMKLYSAEDVRVTSTACVRNGQFSDYIEFTRLNYSRLISQLEALAGDKRDDIRWKWLIRRWRTHICINWKIGNFTHLTCIATLNILYWFP